MMVLSDEHLIISSFGSDVEKANLELNFTNKVNYKIKKNLVGFYWQYIYHT